MADERAELDRCLAQYAATITRVQENDSRRAVEATTRVAVLQASKDKAWQDYERMLGSYSELTARFGDLKAKLTHAALADTAKSKKLADAARDRAAAERARDAAAAEAEAAAAREREALREVQGRLAPAEGPGTYRNVMEGNGPGGDVHVVDRRTRAAGPGAGAGAGLLG